jgi:hypothetical protein
MWSAQSRYASNMLLLAAILNDAGAVKLAEAEDH